MQKLRAKFPVVVCCSLWNKETKQFLIELRKAKGTFPGVWSFPGGKVEVDDDNPEVAICREMQEEIDVLIHPRNLKRVGFSSYEYEERNLILFYICEKWSGTPKAITAQEIKWVDIQELFQLQKERKFMPSCCEFISDLENKS